MQYGPAGGLPAGTLVSVLLDRHSSMLGIARLRAPGGSPGREELDDQVNLLLREQAADPRAAAGFAALLVAYRTGPAGLLDRDRWLWSSLRARADMLALRPADVLVSTSAGWFTVRAGTSGPAEPAWHELSENGPGQNGIVTKGEE